jgi:hypothetical protein
MSLLKLVAVVGILASGLIGEHSRLSAAHGPAPSGSALATASSVDALVHHVFPGFEPNRGQAAHGVRFLSRAAGYTLLLTTTGAIIVPALRDTSGPERLRSSPEGTPAEIRFVSSSSHPTMLALHRLPGIVNYFIGRDPRGWRTRIPTYARVVYKHLYPRIDLVFYGRANASLEYDWLLRPGANPSDIRLRVTGARGEVPETHPRLSRGNVIVGRFILGAPRIYQQVRGRRHTIDGRFVVEGATIRLQVSRYDRTRPLIVDPTIEYLTYLGGTGTDDAKAIAADGLGNAYLTGGVVGGAGYPLLHPLSSASNGIEDAFVSKLDASGTLLYSTFLGGNGGDEAHAIAIDPSGDAYVTGVTGSGLFPVLHAVQQNYGGGRDAFVTGLDPTGSALLFSTYLGGSQSDGGDAITLDGQGHLYVGGYTPSTNFPTAAPIQASLSGGNFLGDAFLAELSLDGTQLLFSTYLGGSADDNAAAIRVDGAGNIYVAGSTRSSDFHTVNALPGQATYHGGTCGPSDEPGPCADAYLLELSPTHAVIYDTLLGGGGDDYATGLAIDAANNVYLSGDTSSPDFPVKAAQQPSYGGNQDGFVVKLSPGGTLVYSTFLGGKAEDDINGVAVLGDSAYLVGDSQSGDLPLVNAPAGVGSFHSGTCGTAPNVRPCEDAFVAAIDGSGQSLKVSFYLGGAADEYGDTIAAEPSSFVDISGFTRSPDLPVVNALQPAYGGTGDAFVARIAEAPLILTPTPTPTFTPTATFTPTPTQTPKLTPTHTATPKPKKTLKCKKGYKKVKNKKGKQVCQKIKKT